MVGGMSQVTGKTAVGIFMALLTGIDYIVQPNTGFGIIHIQNQMCVMAIGALSRAGITQFMGLTVHGIQVGGGQFFVTGTALIGDLEHKLIPVRFGNLVGGVAMSAGRQFVGLPLLGGEVYTAGELFIDTPVTGSAGGRYIPGMY